MSLDSESANGRLAASVEQKFRDYVRVRNSRSLYKVEELPPAAELLDVPALDSNVEDVQVFTSNFNVLF